MRKKRDYVVKGKRIFIGLEDSLKSWKLCVRSEGIIIHEGSVPTEYDNLRRYLQRGYPGCEIKVMYEAGFHGFWLHDLLAADGIECVLTPANKVTQEKDRRVKTDRIDARRLAKNLESGDYVSCWVPDRELREDRQVCRCQLQVQRKITACKAQIRMFFYFHGVAIPEGKWSQEHYDRLRKLELSESLRQALDSYLDTLLALEENSKSLKSQLRSLSRKERYRESVCLKQSCPGVAFLSAIRFTLECGDLSRFANGKQFASYLGLTTSEHSTGERTRRGRITRQGRSQLRAWMIECAWTAIRKDPVLLDKFQRVWHNSGSKGKAIVAVARKLAVRIHALETSHQPYEVGVIQ